MTQQQITMEQALEMAARYAREGKHDDARKLYRQILQIQPDNKAVQRALSELPAGAQESNFSTDMRRLIGLYNDGALDQATAEAQRLIQTHPTQPMPLNILGVILLQQGQPEQAAQILRKAAELAPEYPDTWSNLGNAQIELNDADGAMASYRQALALSDSPGILASANTGLGKVLAIRGKLAEARASFEQALTHNPGDSKARTALAMTLRELGETGAAIAHFRGLLQEDPTNARGQMELGLALRRNGESEAAIECMKKSIELAPTNSRAHLHLGQLYFQAGDKERAAQYYREVLALDPDSAEAPHLLDAIEGRRTSKASAEYVTGMFDVFSSTFEQQLVNTLEYKAPEVLSRMISNQLNEGQIIPSAIDLGCGTGLMGERLRERVAHQIGVDLSPGMLERAAEKAVYAELLKGDIVDVLNESALQFELVVSADVLIYLGDLQPLMSAVVSNAAPQALLAISTELSEDSDSYELLGSGRYSHSKDYVCATADAAGLDLLEFEYGPLRKESGEWLKGGYYLFRKRT